MTQIVLKTGKRKTTVSKAAIRKAVAAAFAEEDIKAGLAAIKPLRKAS